MNTTIKSLLAALPLLGLATAAAATDPTPKAEPWSPAALRQELNAMPTGDAARGASLHNGLMCNSCHGDAGVAPTRNYPDVAGQRAEYTYKMLLDYKTMRRFEGPVAGVMETLTQELDRQGMADVAAYYATLPGKPMAPATADPSIATLVTKGDVTRLITPCASCHGRNGQGGKNETPALTGQGEHYLARTLRAYRDGRRDNDAAQGMAQLARELTDAEIDGLAAYYAGQPAAE